MAPRVFYRRSTLDPVGLGLIQGESRMLCDCFLQGYVEPLLCSRPTVLDPTWLVECRRFEFLRRHVIQNWKSWPVFYGASCCEQKLIIQH